MFFKTKPVNPLAAPLFTAGIPKVIHQIWLGGKPVPPQDQQWADGLKALHPTWQYRLWTENELPGLFSADPFGIQAAVDRAYNYGYQSDLLRLLILWRHGGVYLDTDIEGLRPLDPLIEGADGFIGATFQPQPHPGIWLENAVLATSPGHPFLAQVLTTLAEASKAWPAKGEPIPALAPLTGTGSLDTVYLTGPGMLSTQLDLYRRRQAVNGTGLPTPLSLLSDMAVIPPRFLYAHVPDWGQIGPAPDASHAYLRHHWSGKWFRPDGGYYVAYGPYSAPNIASGKGV